MDALMQRLEAHARSSDGASVTAAWCVAGHRKSQEPLEQREPLERKPPANSSATRSFTASRVTLAALFDWIDALRDAVRASQSDARSSDEGSDLPEPPAALVLGVALPSCSAEESAAVLAVARERRWAFVPVDAYAPLAQQAAVLRAARADALVTTPEAPIARFLADELLVGGPPREVAASTEGLRPAVVFRVPSAASRATISQMVAGARDGVHVDADPLYVLFTSGSSGRPKGVVGSRAGALNRLEWMWTQFPFAVPAERVARVTKLTFVDAVWEILGALLRQVPLVHLEPAAPGTRRSSVVLDDSELFAHAAQQLQVSRFTVVPSVLEVLLLQLRSAPRLQHALASVRLVLVSGEVLPLRLALQVTRALPHARLLNLYGSTEVSGDVTWMEIPAALSTAQAARWTRLGVPIGSVHNRVGDTALKLAVGDGESVAVQPPGAERTSREGELHVAGSALALGYVAFDEVRAADAHPSPTSSPSSSATATITAPGSDVDAAAKWVAEPASDGGARQTWFRTGDVCRVVGDEIFFCGRRDTLVKIRGQRVHLEAVERAVGAELADADAATTASVVVVAMRSASASELSGLALVAFLLQASSERRASDDDGDDCPQAQLSGVAPFSQKATLLQRINDKHGDVFVPRDVVLVSADSVARLSSGKLDRVALRALYEAGAAAAAGERRCKRDASDSGECAAPASRARRFVDAQVRRLLIMDAATALEDAGDVLQRTFQELGGNSLHAALFCWEARQELGCSLLTHDVLSRTMAAVVDSLDTELAAKRERCVERDSSEDASLSVGDSVRTPKRAKRDLAPQETDSAAASAWSSLSRANGTSFGDARISSVRCASRAAPPRLAFAWRVGLSKCVDASPLIVRRSRQHGSDGVDADETRVVVGSHAAELVCVDAESRGAVVWKRLLDGRIEASAAFSTSTGTVYVGTYSGTLYAIDFATGADRWAFRAAGAIKAAVRVIDELQLVVCGAYDHAVYGVDSVSGEQRWVLSADGGSVFSTPAYLAATRQLFVASTSGYVCCAALGDLRQRRAPVMRWHRHLPAPVFSSLAVSPTARLVFVGCADGAMYALDADSGDVRWRHATEKPVFSSPSVYSGAHGAGGAGECVLFGSHDGVLRKVTSATGEFVWAVRLGSPIFGSPAVFDAVRAAGDDAGAGGEARRRMCCAATVGGALFLCDESTGEIMSNCDTDGDGSSDGEPPEPLGELFSSPVVAGGLCLIGSRANALYAFRLS